MCDYCSNDKIYQTSNYCDIAIEDSPLGKTLVVKNIKKGCPPYANCSCKDMNVNAVFLIKYCPECGKKLDD